MSIDRIDAFETSFQSITQNRPLLWQRRLYDQLCNGPIPRTIGLPTGLGKTSVIVLWYLARLAGAKLPTRLVYVVDRRTVVDQATEYAQRIRKFDANLIVSTLRGQWADNREWTHDPSKPAIIIGTVDMIGSRLLFSGYRSSFKQRPLDAGLLGQDSLLILDEAHLSKPFDYLLEAIANLQKSSDRPIQIVRMSATHGNGDQSSFRLNDKDKEDSVIAQRYFAIKLLTVKSALKGQFIKTAVEEAQRLSADGSRVVVFVRSPDDAAKIAATLQGRAETLTGTMRGLERDALLTRPIMKRFLTPVNTPADGPAILVSTSAGEVGFDLNADHMVCDPAPLDSQIQRMGRVNRRGEGNAKIILVHQVVDSADGGKKKSAAKMTRLEKAIAHTTALLQPDNEQERDVSPAALDRLRQVNAGQIAAALSPEITTAELTDILLDQWSMTAVVEPIPGRPPVAAWLRGISEDPPHTTIAWRTELDVAGFADLDLDDIAEWLDTHRVLPHETLSVPTSVAANWLLHLLEAAPTGVTIIDRGGLQKISLSSLLTDLLSEHLGALVDADLILPASLGGISKAGLLESSKNKSDGTADVADAAVSCIVSQRTRYLDICAEGEHHYQDLCSRHELSEKPSQVGMTRFAIELPACDDERRWLVSLVPKAERPDFVAVRQSLKVHVDKVSQCAADIANRLHLEADDPIRQALLLAAHWHDHGKNRDLWQSCVRGQATAAGQPWHELTLAKSDTFVRSNTNGYRHEFGSMRELLDSAPPISQDVLDLALHMIATHHGRSRPHFPRGGFDPEARARSPELHAGAIQRFVRLQHKYGYWRLAWLESLLRCADAMASSETGDA